MLCPRYDEMKACWSSEPDSRPTFTVLGERMSELLCSGAGEQYLQLTSIEESNNTNTAHCRTLPKNFRSGERAQDNLETKSLQRQMTFSNPGYKCSFNS